jgi:metal-responsive CopG/Arc/MetJ family transcriptional regulator
MRTTEIMTISLPPAMARQMEEVQKEEHRTRSELLREAWRQYFESRYAVYTPTKTELAAIRKGRSAFKRGEFVPLGRLHHELDAARNQTRKKGARKAS